MKKMKMSTKLLTALGAFGGLYFGFKYTKNADEKLKFNEILAAQTDWKDEHHLRFCDETYIDKRFLPYKSSVNMRDIGGYSNNEGRIIKWNKIYRGEELCHLSEEDLDKFKKLGINYVIDLRNYSKFIGDPDPRIEGVKYINIPVLHDMPKSLVDFSYPNVVDQFMRNIYTELCTKRGEMFAQILEILVFDPDAKIYIHCTNGKDRTGFAIAMIMLLAGIPIDKVISEYSLSNYHVNKAFKLFDNEIVKEIGEKSGRLLYGTIGVDPDWLNLQLRYINQNFEGIFDYLLRNSLLRKYDLMNVRNSLLEWPEEKKDGK